MFGFSTADWLFIGFILLVILLCVVASNSYKKKAGG